MEENFIQLFHGEIERLFPFHCIFDIQFNIAGYGSSLRLVVPQIECGRKLYDFFFSGTARENISLDTFKNCGNVLFLFFVPETQCRLRGQVIKDSRGRFIFLGSLWLTAPEQMRELGLSIKDFAVHEPVVDLMQLVQSQKIALMDLEKLAYELKKQRKEIRDQARESRKLALIASRTDNAVILTNAKGEIEWVNDGFSRITGFGLDEIRGQKPGSFLQGPMTQADVIHRIREKLKQGKGFREELINYKKDGTPYWVQIEVQPIYDEFENLTHYMAIEADITQAKLFAENLRNEKDLLELTLSTITEAVLTTSHEGLIELMNESASILFGITPRSAIGKSIYEFINLTTLNGENIESIYENSRNELEEQFHGSLFDLNSAVILTNYRGRKRHVTFQTKIMQPGFALVSKVLLIFRDVEEEFEIERMKADFVSSVSHELRTPLTSIKGYISTILDDPNMPEDTRHQFLKVVYDQSNRLQDLVDDLLEISRLESAPDLLSSNTMVPGNLILKVTNHFLITAERNAIQIKVDVTNPSTRIPGDSGQFESVLTNLISNAIKFTPRGGSIRIHSFEDEEWFYLKVQDTGMGIPEKDQQRIFHKFFRVDRPGVEIQGTGLGLAIVKTIIDGFRGTISLQSEVNAGTAFLVQLPIKQAT
ncbi:MAG: PAS domain-containing protein [Verrucomicrobia bacterium]|nr:PAS domain-containing protein [Verrucomicrobiota bacterium]